MLNNNKGIALLYILAAMVLCTIVGISLVNLAHYDSKQSSDYNSMHTASISANSGIKACNSMFEKQPHEVVSALNKFLNEDYTESDKGWLMGNNSSPITIKGQQKYYVEILGFDSVNFVLQVKITGLGKSNSTNNIIGIYKLNGIGFYKEDCAVAKQKALYFTGLVNFYKPIKVVGGIYTERNIIFDDQCVKSVFDGAFICKGDAEFNGNYTFKNIVYVGNKFSALLSSYTPSFGVTFEKKSGFEGVVEIEAPSQKIDMLNDTYFNSNFYGNDDYINNMNYNVFNHSGSVTDAETRVDNYSSINDNGYMDIPSEIGVDINQTPPYFNGCAISYYKILDWKYLRNKPDGTPGYAEHSIPSYVNSDRSKALTGNLANAIWEYARKRGKLWNGFAVVKICNSYCSGNVYAYNNDGTFEKKIIFLNEGDIQFSSRSNGGWPNCSDNSMTVIYNKGNLQWGQNNSANDKFIGYIYNSPCSYSFYVGNGSYSVNKIVGAIHNLKNSTTNWYSNNNGNTSIEYSLDIMDELLNIGLVRNVGSVLGVVAPQVITDSLVLVSSKIEYENMGVHY